METTVKHWRRLDNWPHTQCPSAPPPPLQRTPRRHAALAGPAQTVRCSCAGNDRCESANICRVQLAAREHVPLRLCTPHSKVNLHRAGFAIPRVQPQPGLHSGGASTSRAVVNNCMGKTCQLGALTTPAAAMAGAWVGSKGAGPCRRRQVGSRAAAARPPASRP